MSVKIRLSRHGKKGHPYFHIIVADARAPRDGKYIERLGFYNPTTNPATIDIDVDSAVDWLAKGAQPTDTARAILSYKGVLYKSHLLKGVKKGAFDEAEAEKRFEAWQKEKQEKVESKISSLATSESQAAAERLQAETEKNQARAAAIAAANAPEPEPEVEAPEATDTPVAEAPSEEAKEIVAEKPEVTVEEAAEKVAKAEEKAETPAKEEAEKTEAKAEETPAKEEKEEGKE